MKGFIGRFSINDGFVAGYQRIINDNVIPYEEKAIRDEIEGAAKSGAVANFEAAAEALENGGTDKTFYGMVFQDSDVAKWLEAAAYDLVLFPDKELERRCDEMIALVGRAQEKDGYLDTYFTLARLGRVEAAKTGADGLHLINEGNAPNGERQPFSNLMEAHELYCAGHMIEAGVAYAQCTGKTGLLDIVCRLSDRLYDEFITKGREGYPGHPEIELALMRLYDHTGNRKYYELAKHFIDVRGVDRDFYRKEKEKRNWQVWGMDPEDTAYFQCDAPVRDLKYASGHAVRVVYLLSGAADVARESGDERLKEACERLWKNITQKRMYLTGGIGSCYEGEAFTEDFHLPNDTAYAETCASIGLMFFARRMLKLGKKGEYGDVMERAFYNGVLSGMTLSGTEFFYVNPLESLPGISGKAKTHKHALPVRPKWFACACCPPNIARLLPSIADYAFEKEGNTLYSHLFIGGELDLKDEFGGKIKVATEYPFKGEVSYEFYPDSGKMDMTLAVRLPEWSRDTEVLLNGNKIYGAGSKPEGAGEGFEISESLGYLYISGKFGPEDKVTLKLDMRARTVYADTRVSADTGKIAYMRGPLVYCAEGRDNNGSVLDLRVFAGAQPLEEWSDELNGIVTMTVPGQRICKRDEERLYYEDKPEIVPEMVHMIPYYAWANRGENEMRVWLTEAAAV